MAGHVIFTTDGNSVIGDEARRLHRLRRSFCKSWRNDKWRDLLRAFWHWLSAGASPIEIPLGDDSALQLKLPPMMWDASFGIDTAGDQEIATAEEEDHDEDDEEFFEDDGEAVDLDDDEADTDEDI